MCGSYIQLKFDQIGKYTIRIEVSDTNNNWSNWRSSSIEVKEASLLKNVTLTSDDYNIDYGFKWGDYAQSIQYAKSGLYSAEEVFAMTTVDRKPSYFGNKKVLGVNWKVSGYVVTPSGNPVSNETVTITVPMSIGKFRTEVSTDSNGYFTYTCNKTLWYKNWSGYEGILSIADSGITSDWCLYGNENTTTWLYGTELIVESEYSEQSFEVIATTGSILKFVLGDRWVRNRKGGEWTGAY